MHRPDILGVVTAGGTDRAAVEDSRRSISYGALAGNIGAIARLLAESGVGCGDRVAVAVPNSVAAVEIYLACAAVGAIWVGVNPASPDGEKHRQFDVVAPRAVIADPATAVPEEAILIDAGPLLAGVLPPLPLTLSGVPDLDAPSAIAFSSGTTGMPKAIVHSRANVSLVAASLASRTLRNGDRVGLALPVSIHNVMIIGPLANLVAGATTVMVNRLNAVGLAAACQAEKLTLLRAFVPAAIYDLVHLDDVVPAALSSLRVAETGAAGLAEPLRSDFEKKFGLRVVGSYGLSEAPAVVCWEESERPHRPGASGVPLPHVSIAIRGVDGAPAPRGAEGEVWVGPAADGPWAGYYRPALGTWSGDHLDGVAHEGNWFATGDIGWLDDDGAVHITARKADVIVRGGVNVTATELQAVLGELDGVREAAVIGRPHPRLGERIIAFLEPRLGVVLDEQKLRSHAEKLLSHTKVPDEFVIVDSLPRNAMGKVARGELSRYAEERVRE